MSLAHTLAVAASLMIYASAAGAVDCAAPEAPDVPDGQSASEQEMLDAQQEVKGFVSEGQQYMGCLKAEEQALGEDASDKDRKKIITLYNDMVDEMQAASDEFNSAVRAYQASNQ